MPETGLMESCVVWDADAAAGDVMPPHGAVMELVPPQGDVMPPLGVVMPLPGALLPSLPLLGALLPSLPLPEGFLMVSGLNRVYRHVLRSIRIRTNCVWRRRGR